MYDVAWDYLGFVEDNVFHKVVGSMAMSPGIWFIVLSPAVLSSHVPGYACDCSACDQFEPGEFIEFGWLETEAGIH